MNTTMTAVEIAELNYFENQNDKTERALHDAKKAADLAEAKARGLAHKATQDARRAAEKAAGARTKRLAECVKLAQRVGPELQAHAQWFGEQHVAAAKRVDAMRAAIDTHNRLVREAHALAAVLAVDVEMIPQERYGWNAMNVCARAQREALLAAGMRGVGDYWHEAHE